MQRHAEQLVVRPDGPPADQAVALDAQAAPRQPIRWGEVDSLSAVDAWEDGGKGREGGRQGGRNTGVEACRNEE